MQILQAAAPVEHQNMMIADSNFSLAVTPTTPRTKQKRTRGEATGTKRKRKCTVPEKEDLGGNVVSVGVAWFNNKGGWKKQFQDAKRTYCVAMCTFSDTTKGQHQHTLQILGDYQDGAFTVGTAQFRVFQEQWKAHGEPMVPLYTWKKSVGVRPILEDNSSPKKFRHKSKQKTVLGCHPALAQVDLLSVTDDRDLKRQAVFKERKQVVRALAIRLGLAVTNLLSKRNPWSWAANSCHVDTWLMVQLASYHHWVTADKEVSDAQLLPDQQPGSARLLCVLLSVGSPEQDKLRDAYWATEIDLYGMLCRFGCFCDPGEHYLAHNHLDIRCSEKIRVFNKVTCTNPEHAERVEEKHLAAIRVSDYWFSLSDADVKVKTADNKWFVPTAAKHRHMDTNDVVHTAIARSDGSIGSCTACGNNFFVSRTKMPGQTHLPLFLRLEALATAEHIPCATLDIGGVHYTLVAVIFANGIHFNCNIRFLQGGAGRWYSYDDMGVVGEKRRSARINTGTGQYPAEVRLRVLTSQDLFWSPFKTGFRRDTYHYVRSSGTAPQGTIWHADRGE